MDDARFVAEQAVVERQARARRGAALCWRVLNEIEAERGLARVADETDTAPSVSDAIRERARQRAVAERRAAREAPEL